MMSCNGTQFMVLTAFPNEIKDLCVSLDLGRVQLTYVVQAPILGIIFDSQLKFTAHVLSLVHKANFQILNLERLA